jgi:hypothetical protein
LGRVLEMASRVKRLQEKEGWLILGSTVALFALTKQRCRASEGVASEDQRMKELKEVNKVKEVKEANAVLWQN